MRKIYIILVLSLVILSVIFYQADNQKDICYLKGSLGELQFDSKFNRPVEDYIKEIARKEDRIIDIPFYFSGNIFLRGPCLELDNHIAILEKIKFNVSKINKEEYQKQRERLSSGDYVLDLR